MFWSLTVGILGELKGISMNKPEVDYIKSEVADNEKRKMKSKMNEFCSRTQKRNKKQEKDRVRGGRGGLGRSFVALWKFSLQTLSMQPSPELTDHRFHTATPHLLWENIPKEPRVKKTQVH